MHVWDLDQKRNVDMGPESKRARVQLPQELMLTHAGHRAPVSFLHYALPSFSQLRVQAPAFDSACTIQLLLACSFSWGARVSA